MHSSHDFLGRPFFFFPVISSPITSRIWELIFWRMTWPYYCRQLWNIFSIFTTTPTSKSISWHPISWSHPTHHLGHMTLHSMQPCLICNSKFPCFTTVRQNWSNTAMINLLPVSSKINPASQLTHQLTTWTSTTCYHFLHSLPQMLQHNN